MSGVSGEDSSVASQQLEDAVQLVVVSQLNQGHEVGSTGSGEPPAKRLHIEQDGDISMDQSIKRMSGVSGEDSSVASQQLEDAVQLVVVSQLNQGHEVASTGSGEPPAKRLHIEQDGDISMDQSIKQILFNINKAICLRLDGIETKLETVSVRTRYLEEKVEQVVSNIKQNGSHMLYTSTPMKSGRSSAVIVGLPQDRAQYNSPICDSQGSMSYYDQSLQNLGPNVQLITLNTEEDFPNGTWLGDESNHEMRVRVPITPSDILHVHSNCRTPEKMALALLDYLFDRETQATSNLSGMGKLGKKQLDPLMVYGVRCHLIYRFGITEQDWHRIKQNIDSKCRTAFRRKVRGLPLTVKAFRGKAPATYMHVMNHPSIAELNSDDSLHEDSELHIHQGEIDLQAMQAAGAAEIIQTAGGEIQVLHATPEQVAQLQQAHQIQILQGDATQVMQLQQGDGQDSIQVAVSMAQQDGIQLVTTETGETIQIKTNPVDGTQEVQIQEEEQD